MLSKNCRGKEKLCSNHDPSVPTGIFDVFPVFADRFHEFDWQENEFVSALLCGIQQELDHLALFARFRGNCDIGEYGQ
jgi:hypothetical protein